MNSLLDPEEEEGKASEITLSTASLLGIFFGLVLICGVFFGFGYSMGRGSGSAAPTAAEPEETRTAAPPQPAALAPAEQDESLAAVAPSPSVTRAKHEDAGASVKSTEDAGEETPAAPVRTATSKPSAGQPMAASPATGAPNVDVANAAPGSGQAMVQIAAVARAEDADALVAALRQRGYGVVVRSEPQDKLIHVQVGPFADRTQATAMKQKLLSDGYNAIIKQ
jgi:cell division protein FtsN